ncbi:FMRFamide-activated amiloride-sensitive sodium channel-like isoform X2 [Haemaphysalis longicornis]
MSLYQSRCSRVRLSFLASLLKFCQSVQRYELTCAATYQRMPNLLTLCAQFPATGLRMVLDAEIDEYLPLSSEVGFKVMIHQPGVESDYSRNGINIPPEYATYLRIEQMTIRRLEPPYPEPCRHDWPPGYEEILFTKTRYTLQKCLDVCLQLTIVQQCKCIDQSVRTFNISGVDLCCKSGKRQSTGKHSLISPGPRQSSSSQTGRWPSLLSTWTERR